jgi:hypothetical protein
LQRGGQLCSSGDANPLLRTERVGVDVDAPQYNGKRAALETWQVC